MKDVNSRGGRYHKICEDCGAEFNTSSKVRNLCYKEHYHTCPICGKSFKVSPYPPQSITCGKKCAGEWKARRLEEEYGPGIRSTLQLDEVKEKCAKTSLEHYGTPNPMSSRIVQNRLHESCVDRYGENYREEFFHRAEETWKSKYGENYRKYFQQLSIETCQDRYGVDYVFQDEGFKQNSIESCRARYGVDHYTQSDDFRSKATKTWENNYGDGIDNPLKSPEVRQRVMETCLKRYGVRNPGQNPEIRNRIRENNILHHANSLIDPSRREEYLKFRSNPAEYLKETFSDGSVGLSQLAYIVGLADPTILYTEVHKNGLEDLIGSNMSIMEQEVFAFIQTIAPELEIRIHDRSVIHPLELDFYIPEYQIAIECNPTSTHNSTFVLANILGDMTVPPLDIHYHQNKSRLCKDAGIFLFHIFGYEWHHSRLIIQSMIRNLLHKDLNRYYARKLTIKEVPPTDAINFLQENHRQGGCQSSLRYGLFDDDKLVSLMTFGNLRPTMGKTSSSESIWELSRFCNIRNSSVVGGASRLFHKFLCDVSPGQVVSFSDVSHTRGNLYSKLGFRLDSLNKFPGYVWVNQVTDIYFNRVSCQKRNLRKLFQDPELDIDNKTEDQIMSEHGFVKVYDSGLYKWVYENT